MDKKTIETIKRLILIHRPYVGRMIIAFIGMIITATTEPIAPYFLRILMDEGFIQNPDFPFWMVPAIAIGLMVIRGGSIYISTYMMTWVSTNVLKDLRTMMFSRILHASNSYYANTTVGRLINSMMQEAQMINGMVTGVFIATLRSGLTVIGLIAWLFYLNWQLSLITIVLMPTLAFALRVIGRRLKDLNRLTVGGNAVLTQVIEETSRAQQVVKIFGAQKYEEQRFSKFSEDVRMFAMKTIQAFAATMPVTQILSAAAISVVVVVALSQSSKGEMTAGAFVSFITAMLMLLQPLRQISEVYGPMTRGMVAAESVFGMIDAPIERESGMVLTKRAEGRIDFEDVVYSYPKQKKAALQGVTLHVSPGETIALVGMSGGGKTTMVNLLPEFLIPTKGRILLDGIPISDISLKSLREQIAMVNQHVILFDDTITANVAYGDLNPDMKRVEAAIEAAHLKEVMASLPEGYKTRMGENGGRFSGGQRQRFAIARAIYKDAPVLILDEATSALDTESERAVQAALDGLMKNRTTFVIAHRLSTVEGASRIVVLTEGKITEIGTHKELLEADGAYANFYRLQFSEDAEKTKQES